MGELGGRPSFKTQGMGRFQGFGFFFPGWAASRVGLGSSLGKALPVHPILSPRDVAGVTRASCPLRSQGPGSFWLRKNILKKIPPTHCPAVNK